MYREHTSKILGSQSTEQGLAVVELSNPLIVISQKAALDHPCMIQGLYQSSLRCVLTAIGKLTLFCKRSSSRAYIRIGQTTGSLDQSISKTRNPKKKFT